MSEVFRVGHIVRSKSHDRLDAFEFGIVVAIKPAAQRFPLLAVVSYDASGQIQMDPSGLPAIGDVAACEVVLWHDPAEIGYDIINHDVYPYCEFCDGEGTFPGGDGSRDRTWCSHCKGGRLLRANAARQHERVIECTSRACLARRTRKFFDPSPRHACLRG